MDCVRWDGTRRRWHRQRNTTLARIAEDEFPRFDRPSLTRQLLAFALVWRLIDAVLVAQRIQIALLGSEVLNELRDFEITSAVSVAALQQSHGRYEESACRSIAIKPP